MALELVIFDLAGTTVKDNFDVHRVLQKSLSKHNVDITIDDANEVMGIPKPVAIETLLRKRYKGTRPILKEWIEEIHADFVEHMIAYYANDPFVSEKEGVGETFSRLKAKKLKIYVDTGFNRPITDAILKRVGWLKKNLIDGSITSDEVEFGRPFPDMIYKAMMLAGVSDPQNVAKVGDTTSDLLQGLNAGCRFVIGLTTGAHSKRKLMKEYHTHLINNIEEVVPILT
jgi:phosphonatase-like hydrolase